MKSCAPYHTPPCQVIVWPYPSVGAAPPLLVETRHRGIIFGVAFLPKSGNSRLVTGGMDNSVQLHELPPTDIPGVYRMQVNCMTARSSIDVVLAPLCLSAPGMLLAAVYMAHDCSPDSSRVSITNGPCPSCRRIHAATVACIGIHMCTVDGGSCGRGARWQYRTTTSNGASYHHVCLPLCTCEGVLLRRVCFHGHFLPVTS
jgi:hypothetical protein